MNEPKKYIALSPKIHLPYEFVTQRTGILGRTRMGKSNTASIAAEECLRIGAQVVILDRDGSWYGLRVDADGEKKSGLDIAVIGDGFCEAVPSGWRYEVVKEVGE